MINKWTNLNKIKAANVSPSKTKNEDVFAGWRTLAPFLFHVSTIHAQYRQKQAVSDEVDCESEFNRTIYWELWKGSGCNQGALLISTITLRRLERAYEKQLAKVWDSMDICKLNMSTELSGRWEQLARTWIPNAVRPEPNRHLKHCARPWWSCEQRMVLIDFLTKHKMPPWGWALNRVNPCSPDA